MAPEPRPGPKPKRLYVRWVRLGEAESTDRPAPRVVRSFLSNLDRVGRLVAHGEVTEPPGDLLVLRAVDLAEARRILRADPYLGVPSNGYDVLSWNPLVTGSGVNLEPPPARGAGRLTSLQRVTVVVRDQAASIAWYQDVLGLSVREKDPETGFVELSLGRGAAALSLVAPRPEWGEPFYSESAARIGSVTGIVFQTDSVLALDLRLRHAGARVTQPPQPQPWGGLTVRFSDPDGNEFLAFQAGGTDLDDPPVGPALPGERSTRPSEKPSRRTARARRTSSRL